MRRVTMFLLAAAIAGCGMVSQEDAKIKARNEAEDAAVKRMIAVQGDTIPGHPKLTELGKVQGVCGRAPAYDDDSSSASVEAFWRIFSAKRKRTRPRSWAVVEAQGPFSKAAFAAATARSTS